MTQRFKPQEQFVLRLYQALFGESSEQIEPAAIDRLVDAWITWMARAMKSCEAVFLWHTVGVVAQRTRITNVWKTATGCRVLAQRIHAQVSSGGVWKRDAGVEAACIAMLALQSQDPSVQRALSTLQRVVTAELSEDPLPHIHSSISVLAMVLASEDSERCPPLLRQLRLCRVTNLSLLSARLHASDACVERLEAMWRNELRDEVVNGLSDSQRRVVLKMLEAFATEVSSAVESSPELYYLVLQELHRKTSLSSDTDAVSAATESALRPSLESFLSRSTQQFSTTVTFPVQSYLTRIYGLIISAIEELTPSLSLLSPDDSISVFATLSKIAFAREVITSQRSQQQRFASVSAAVARRVEQHVDASADAVLPQLCRLVLQHDSPSSCPRALNIIWGFSALNVGQLLQRKLRVLLFQSSASTRADAMAVVLAGALHGLAPLDTFAHRFLSFTLSDLSQFVAVEHVAPLYLQRVVSMFPDTDVSRERLTSAASAVFGALYFSPVGLHEHAKQQRDRDAITVWALRLCRERVTSLLLLSQRHSSAAAVDQAAAPPAPAREETPTETDALEADRDLPPSHDAGVFFLELFVELAKMAPLPLLPRVAREIEMLVHETSVVPTTQATVQQRVFSAIATNCEAEKRAWFTAWYLDLASRYATAPAIDRMARQTRTKHNDVPNAQPSSAPLPRSRL
ncbi:hypothetical protein PINS_up009045 [Pythium insidiosum]|nr:hypothetical protein PINS_up009045 [Pythium insidiosum]